MGFAAWYLIITVALLFLLYYMLIKTSLITNNTGSISYRLWGAVIFQFAISIRFREDFDFLLTLSNTRLQIYQSFIGVAVIFSAFYSGLIVLEKVIVDHLNTILGLHTVKDIFHFLAPYAIDNLVIQFVYFFMLCLFFSVSGLLIGSLFYRFGNKFVLAFWLLFSAIPTVVFPLYLWILHLRSNLDESIRIMGDLITTFDVTAGAGVLFVLTVIFGIATWLNIQHLSQK